MGQNQAVFIPKGYIHLSVFSRKTNQTKPEKLNILESTSAFFFNIYQSIFDKRMAEELILKEIFLFKWEFPKHQKW